MVNEPSRDGLQGVFIRAAHAKPGGAERWVSLNEVVRIDDFNGQMRLAFRQHSRQEGQECDLGFYFVPDLSYQDALKAIKKVNGAHFIDLKNL